MLIKLLLSSKANQLILDLINKIPVGAGAGAGGSYKVNELNDSKFLDYEIRVYQIKDSETMIIEDTAQ